MLYEQTMQKLYALKLNGMAEALNEQRQNSQISDLSFEDRVGLLVERQWLWREQRALAIRLQSARFKQPGCIEDLNYRHPRGLSRGQLNELSACDWVKHHQTVIITGPTGVGKTWIACALGQKACRDGYSAIYCYAPKLFRELTTAQLDGSLPKVIKRLAKPQVLLLDDWGLESVKTTPYRLFLELLEERQGSGATLVTSQFAVSKWHELIGEATVADAVLDRLLHHAHRIELKGDSLRKRPTNDSAESGA